jgi:hypothetical protein
MDISPYYSQPKTLSDLKELLKTSNQNIEEYFQDLHHFSKHPPFETPSPSFAKFVKYCEGLPRGIESGGENEQTIQRTYRFLELVKSNSLDKSIVEAWEQFPLIKGKDS